MKQTYFLNVPFLALIMLGCNQITGVNDLEFTDSNSDTTTETQTGFSPDSSANSDSGTGSNQDTSSDSSTRSDSNTASDTNTEDSSSGTSTDTDTGACGIGIEASRVCTQNGSVQVLDECNNQMEIVQCATQNGACNQGVCSCAPGWSGEDCSTCVVYVNGSIEKYAGNDGRSWDNPYEGVQNALNLAGAMGCDVWVTHGIYLPTKATDAADPRTQTIQLVEGVTIRGVFLGTENAVEHRDTATNVTILSGDIGIKGDISDNAYHVVTGVTNATIEGFTIRDGNANGTYPNNYGGGMLNRTASPTVDNCILTQNHSTFGAGIANIQNSAPTISNCIFNQNNGSGLENTESSPIVTNSQFEKNSGTGMSNTVSHSIVIGCTFSENTGGGMRNYTNSEPLIINCIFSKNQAAGNPFNQGGGMYNGNAIPVVINSIFFRNSATAEGGAIANLGSPSEIINCTFTENSAAVGGAMFNAKAHPDISNSILWGNIATDENNEIAVHPDAPGVVKVTNSNIQGGWDGTNNMDIDPLFIDVQRGDLRLQSTSQCIDGGNTFLLQEDSTDLDKDDNTNEKIPFDLDGNLRAVGADVDMGAYEVQSQ